MAKRDGLSGTRKAQKALRLGRTVSGAGPSLLSTIEGYLLKACEKYMDLDPVLDQSDRREQAHKIRGIAMCVAKIRLPYEDQRIVTKQIEKEFLRKAKENVA